MNNNKIVKKVSLMQENKTEFFIIEIKVIKIKIILKLFNYIFYKYFNLKLISVKN